MQDGTIEKLLALNSGEITGLIGMTADYSNEGNELEYWIGVEGKGNLSDKFPFATSKCAIIGLKNKLIH